MVVGVEVVPVRDMCVMRRLLMRAGLVMTRGLLVMVGGVFQMFSGFSVMFRSLFRHVVLLCVGPSVTGSQRDPLRFASLLPTVVSCAEAGVTGVVVMPATPAFGYSR